MSLDKSSIDGRTVRSLLLLNYSLEGWQVQRKSNIYRKMLLYKEDLKHVFYFFIYRLFIKMEPISRFSVRHLTEADLL